MRGGLGNDSIDGGAGIDTVDYQNMTLGVNVNLAVTAAQNTNAAGMDIILNFENVLGGSANDIINANALDNRLEGNDGNDYLNGAAGNDTLLGGIGNDNLRGGLGNDVMDGGDGVDYADYRDMSASVVVNLSIITQQNTQAGGLDTLLNLENISSGSGNDTLTGNDLNNVLQGYAGDDSISGGLGNDVLQGGLGKDILRGGLGNDNVSGAEGNDTYVFARGEGADVLVDTDATVGNSDILAFQTGITNSQLWFKHTGNDLVVSVIGTTDQVTIKDWYVSGASTLNTTSVVESISAGGKALSYTKVEALVSAMASFAAPAAGQTTLPSTYQSSLNSVIAANWQ